MKRKKDAERAAETAAEKAAWRLASGLKGSRILIAVCSKKGTFCVPFNAHSNCTRAECKFLHRCNVMISETEICMGEY